MKTPRPKIHIGRGVFAGGSWAFRGLPALHLLSSCCFGGDPDWRL